MTPLNTNHAFTGEYGFLSNMFSVPIVYRGRVYCSTEAAFQAQKCVNDSDRNRFMYIPGKEAKALGKTLELRADWVDVKVQVMREVLTIKFRIPELRKLLLATGDMDLVEYNYWNDLFWGICRGAGENQLGKLLMEIRASILRGDLGTTFCEQLHPELRDLPIEAVTGSNQFRVAVTTFFLAELVFFFDGSQVKVLKSRLGHFGSIISLEEAFKLLPAAAYFGLSYPAEVSELSRWGQRAQNISALTSQGTQP